MTDTPPNTNREYRKFGQDFENETGYRYKPKKWFLQWWGIVVLLMIVVAVISAVVWVIGVGTSPVAGRGEAYKQQQSATNRIEQQASFHQEFESIAGLDRKVTQAKADLDTFNQQHPNVGNGSVYDPLAEQQANLQRDLTGATNSCIKAVADYDAHTQQYLAQGFLDDDLPARADNPADPVYVSGKANFALHDCKA